MCLKRLITVWYLGQIIDNSIYPFQYMKSTFLCNLRMWVMYVIERVTSEATDHVKFGVPQGAVLGLLLFLTFINYIPTYVSPGSTDDCLVYHQILITFPSQPHLRFHLQVINMQVSNDMSPCTLTLLEDPINSH
jgi:hypothetical protein